MSTKQNDPFDLERFVKAQDNVYQQVLSELQKGKKTTHWIWYIFPQIDGLGVSSISKFYAIKSEEEAQAYLKHPVLGERLLECSEILWTLEGKTASQIFGFPDDLKLKSSMTLFDYCSEENSIFHQILAMYFGGRRDEQTLKILKELQKTPT